MKNHKMIREEVFDAINSEREYQIEMTANSERPDMIDDLHVGDTLSAIQHNLSRAIEEWYKGSVPHQNTMVYLRKIAGLCVQAGETHGMPKR